MTAPPGILNKVKFLLNLTKSSNAGESANAQAAADKLIAKFGITPQELDALDAPLWDDTQLLYTTYSIVGWQNRLALAIAKHFDCYIVQETNVHGELTTYHYFVYGGDDEEGYVKFVFATFFKKIHHLLDTVCIGRGPIYQGSYCEGVVAAIKENIEYEGIDLPDVKRAPRKIVKELEIDNSKQALTAPTKKEAPCQDKVDVLGQSLIKDIAAYWRGMYDGQGLSLRDILELEVENETPPALE
jgi:hypothetical protein